MVEPCTSIQNGTVKRARRIIEWRTHCPLVMVRVLPSLWTEIMSYTVYFINRLPVSSYSGAVLYCFWCSTPTLGSPPWTISVCLDVPHMLLYWKRYETGSWHPSGIADMHVGYDLGSSLEEGICVYSGRGRWVHFFLLADAAQTITFHEFITSTTRMKVSAHSKMSAITSAPSKHLTDPHSVSQFGAWGVIWFLAFLYLLTSSNTTGNFSMCNTPASNSLIWFFLLDRH